jgi:hypothetical protein
VSTYQRATDLFMKVSEMFLTYPSIRPYFYEGRDLDAATDDVERERILMAAEIQLDVFDWVCHECEGASEEDRDSWFSFIRSIFESSPVLLAYHLQHVHWHPVLNQAMFGRGAAKLNLPAVVEDWHDG